MGCFPLATTCQQPQQLAVPFLWIKCSFYRCKTELPPTNILLSLPPPQYVFIINQTWLSFWRAHWPKEYTTCFQRNVMHCLNKKKIATNLNIIMSRILEVKNEKCSYAYFLKTDGISHNSHRLVISKQHRRCSQRVWVFKMKTGDGFNTLWRLSRHLLQQFENFFCLRICISHLLPW